MKPLFDVVKVKKPKLNSFDLSHEKKLSFNMGDLVPAYIQEILPGDRFRVNTEIMMRLAPMLAPVMSRVNVYMHFFFVPYRLVWNDWDDFITGGENGVTYPTFPMKNYYESNRDHFVKGSLADYMGIPPAPEGTITCPMHVSQLPFRAYQTIYNEYYRDQNLQAKIEFALGSTDDANEDDALLTMRKRAWEKDYFTSALPWAEKGGEVTIPLGTSAPVVINDSVLPTLVISQDQNFSNVSSGLKRAGLANQSWQQLFDDDNNPVKYDPGNTLEADLSDANEVTINDLRRSFRLQEWLEKNARAGSRYIESLWAHFGVRSSDARLQRPEYLGGGKCPVVMSEVLSTVESDTNPQGNMSGHGIAVGNTNRFNKSFEEHGIVLGIMSVLPRTMYQQGLEKFWTKTVNLDYGFPEFAHIGEQEVKLGEVYHDFLGANDNDQTLWGYQSRYSEYKFKQSSVHGDFRDNLAFWHMGRIFASAPGLNSSFISSDPTHRVFAVTDPSVHKLYCQLYHNVNALRPLPVFGIPSF